MANPFENSFMQPVVYFGGYFRVETSHGTDFVPVDVCGENPSYETLAKYCEGKPDALDDTEADPPELLQGWLARMSAPGYSDCTNWCAFDTEAEAMADLIETYGSDD